MKIVSLVVLMLCAAALLPLKAQLGEEARLIAVL